MMREHRSRLVATACLVLAVLLGGCGGPKKVKVSGTVIRGGEPFKVSPKTYVTITFAPADQISGSTYPARFNQEQGSYQVVVPPGKYRVALIAVPPDGGARIRSPIDASKTYEILKDQKIDLEIGQ
jgi:hypothetical protein